MGRLLVAFALSLALAAPAYGQAAGTFTGSARWGTAGAWTDANADGKADYCQRLSKTFVATGETVVCRLSTGTGFGDSIVSDGSYVGPQDGTAWGDVDGDRRADFCRRAGTAADQQIQCLRSTGDKFVDAAPVPAEWGLAHDVAIADATGDGVGDYCRLTGAEQTPNITCTSLTGGGTVTAGPIDPGDAAGRAWVNFDGDRRVDFCRVVGDGAACSSFTAGTIAAPALGAGFAVGRAWADIDGDGRADYCRRSVSSGVPYKTAACMLSTGTGFGRGYSTLRFDWGEDPGPWYADVNGDGKRDACVVYGVSTEVLSNSLRCRLADGESNFIGILDSYALDIGYETDRAWVDHNGDGKADYCRRVRPAEGGEGIACSTSDGRAIGAPSATPAPPPPPGKPARIVVSLSYSRSHDRFKTLVVKRVPKAATVSATCPKGCARKRYTKRNAAGTVSLKRLVGGRRIKAGTRITVTVKRAGETGAVKTLTTRAGRIPKTATRCLPPGASKPARCS